MVLDPVPTRTAGGILVLEYTVDGELNQHTIRQHVAPFNPVPQSDGNFLYTRAAPKTTITEAGIKETAHALGNLWASYYHATAQLLLKELWYNSGGVMTNIPLPPASDIGVIAGTFEGIHTPVCKRTFEFWSSQNIAADHLYFLQHPCDMVNTQRAVTPTEGGFDARDVAMAAYLSDPGSGIVGRDGYPLGGAGRVSLWWSHSLVQSPLNVGESAGFVLSG